MFLEKVTQSARLGRVLYFTLITIANFVGDGFQFFDRSGRKYYPELFGTLMIVKAHPRRLELLVSRNARRSIICLRLGEQHVVRNGVAVRRSFDQQAKVTLAGSVEVHAKFPGVFENLLSGRFEFTLITFSVSHFLHGQRVCKRLFARAGDSAALPNEKSGARNYNQQD